MITRDGHYILTIDDWSNICRYFTLNPRTVKIKEFPQLTFTEIKAYDIYTNKVLFSFYDHDGMIRVPGNGNLIAYEIDIHQVLDKKAAKPAQEIIVVIKQNVHSGPAVTAKKVAEKLSLK